jgi:predicted transcriptional regulator of viral defense system
MRSQRTFDNLYKIAERQQGCFTSAQAREAGYSTQSQYHHVKTADWERLSRGIFRLRYHPRPPRLDLLNYYLWTSNRQGTPQGVFSHDTALSVYPYSVWVSIKTHITVPKAFNKRAKPPGEIALYRADLKPADILLIENVSVTTPLRTLADLMIRGFAAQHHLVDFVRTSLATNVITKEQLITAELTDREWNLVIPLFHKAGYSEIDEIPISRTIQARA